MKYQHPQIQIEQPAPGHYSVTGLPAHTVFVAGTGHVVAPGTLYISPSVPDDLLESIMADRRAQKRGVPAAEVETTEKTEDPKLDKPLSHHTPDLEKPQPQHGKRRGRPAKKGHA